MSHLRKLVLQKLSTRFLQTSALFCKQQLDRLRCAGYKVSLLLASLITLAVSYYSSHPISMADNSGLTQVRSQRDSRNSQVQSLVPTLQRESSLTPNLQTALAFPIAVDNVIDTTLATKMDKSKTALIVEERIAKMRTDENDKQRAHEERTTKARSEDKVKKRAHKDKKRAHKERMAKMRLEENEKQRAHEKSMAKMYIGDKKELTRKEHMAKMHFEENEKQRAHEERMATIGLAKHLGVNFQFTGAAFTMDRGNANTSNNANNTSIDDDASNNANASIDSDSDAT